MVSSGNVQSDLSSVKSSFEKYSSTVSDMSSSWKGNSYDNFNSKAESFNGEFLGQIESCMSNFASACDLYEQYKNTKDNLNIARSNYNTAVAAGESTSTFSSQISSYESKMSDLKNQINKLLDQVKGVKLTATSLNPSSSDVGGSVKVSSGAQDPNLIYTDDGYVFPFAKGISAPVTSSVGPRNQPTAGASTNHKGTDIGVPEGTEVHSMSGGTITNAGRGDAGGYGNWVRVQHDDGTVALYGHLSKSDYYGVGDRVEAGDLIALTGNEGVSTGPHLHFQIETTDGEILNSENIFDGYWPS